MPSPFPGMDPYLEARTLWPDVQASLITYMRESLQPYIRPKYVARIGERIYLAEVGHSYVLDVLLLQRLREPAASAGVGTEMAAADEPQVAIFVDEEQRLPYLEIIRRETGEVVTMIELLSPVNKEGQGHAQYLHKQAELLSTQVNLVEIDLLGYGAPTILARKVPIAEPADWRYLSSLSRAEQRDQVAFYAAPLWERLPRCRIPLRPPDSDVVLDLGAVFNRCYQVGGYDLLVDYRQLPPVPLRDSEKVWLIARLQASGYQLPAQEP